MIYVGYYSDHYSVWICTLKSQWRETHEEYSLIGSRSNVIQYGNILHIGDGFMWTFANICKCLRLTIGFTHTTGWPEIYYLSGVPKSEDIGLPGF
jgi:hypothetical protein